MNNENKRIVGYDSQTGQPIYESPNIQQVNYQQPINQNINQNNKKTDYNKLIKILFITNIITLILLIVFIVAFALKGSTNSSVEKVQEENKYNPTATNEPISNDWTKYQVGIKGKTLTLPCSYKEFKAISGFHMKSSDEKSYIQNNYSMPVNLYIGSDKNKKLALYVDIKNNTSGDMQNNDAEIVRINQTAYQVNKNKADIITFPGNIEVGMEKTKEDIFSLFGKTDNIREYNEDNYNSITITYTADETYNSINYYSINLLNGKVNELTIDHKNMEEESRDENE